MNVDKVGVGNKLVVPYLLEEAGAGQQLVAPLHHVFQQLKLSWSQTDLTVAAFGRSIHKVDRQRSAAQHLFIYGGFLPYQGMSARNHFNNRERLPQGGVMSR